jgi:hypothetical protein
MRELKTIHRREENARSSPAENEKKATILMPRDHMINIVEAMTEKEISESF